MLNRLLFRFGTAHKEHEKFVYNETGFLLSMVLADGALFGVESVDDLQKKEIPPGENELVLRYNESALKKPILRKCTKAGGVTDETMPKSAFLAIWRSNTSNAGSFYTPTIHAIRRGLGKKVDSKCLFNSSRLMGPLPSISFSSSPLNDSRRKCDMGTYYLPRLIIMYTRKMISN